MKTRREFFKTLAGSAAVVVACVVAPKSLMPKEIYPWKSMSDTIGGKHVPALATSGYARLGDYDENRGTVTATSHNGDDTWQVVEWTNKNGWPTYEGA